MKVKGVIVFEDLGPGVWRLKASDGELYDLTGGDAALRRDGQKVEVSGAVRNDMAGIGMGGGPILEVKSYKVI